ncbi:MAG: DNA repair protein RecO [Burkholderiales bacterium]|nr:DNA repair protein RecO [Burkholderiales bacterium]
MNDLSQRPSQADGELELPKQRRPFIGQSDAGFVLHTYAYRETSLIVETFTRTHGRVVMVAKGAKRPQGTLRGMLNPFQGLIFTWFGKSEMKTLKSAEQEKIIPQLSGAALLSAFYLNELLLKLVAREDPHELLFDVYAATIASLSMLPAEDRPAREIAPILRQFEVTLLQELGYALQLREETDSHTPISADGQYFYLVERGPLAVGLIARQSSPAYGLQLQGKTLLDMACCEYGDPQTQTQSKQLMRMMINHLLGDKILHTRQLIREMR